MKTEIKKFTEYKGYKLVKRTPAGMATHCHIYKTVNIDGIGNTDLIVGTASNFEDARTKVDNGQVFKLS